ncbi:MAG: RES domain-containing protein [Acidobacteria bacterium]|nr:RES domain-containing protein [Acidobacteriota bacterium]
MSSRSGKGSWYRLTSAERRERREVLRSRRGRFHADPEGEPTSYLADTPGTAWAEISAYLGPYANPLAFRLWRIEIPEPVARRLVDLREERERDRWGVGRDG